MKRKIYNSLFTILTTATFTLFTTEATPKEPATSSPSQEIEELAKIGTHSFTWKEHEIEISLPESIEQGKEWGDSNDVRYRDLIQLVQPILTSEKMHLRLKYEKIAGSKTADNGSPYTSLSSKAPLSIEELNNTYPEEYLTQRIERYRQIDGKVLLQKEESVILLASDTLVKIIVIDDIAIHVQVPPLGLVDNRKVEETATYSFLKKINCKKL